LLYVVFTNNRLVSAATGEIPVKLWKPAERVDYSAMHAFGCLCFIHVPKARRKGGKLSMHGARAIFLGYDELRRRSYLCLDLQSHRVLSTRWCRFVDSEFPGFNDDAQIREVLENFDGDVTVG
jgi:hypothetical protein